MQDDGIIQALPLGSDATLDIQDPAMRAKVLHAATVSGQGRNDEVRSIAIALTGTGDRDVGLSYVASAPIWKTAYQIGRAACRERVCQSVSIPVVAVS